MTYIICNKEEATHVKVLRDYEGRFNVVNVSPGRIYEIIKDYDSGFNLATADAIKDDSGHLLVKFHNAVPVVYLKEEVN